MGEGEKKTKKKKKKKKGVTLQEKTCENMRSFFYFEQEVDLLVWGDFVLFLHNASLLSFLHLNLMIPQGGTKHNPWVQFYPKVKLFPMETS